ncbi:hypothetical protein ACFL38_02875 [Candidatus Omnitrophota bacterium]
MKKNQKTRTTPQKKITIFFGLILLFLLVGFISSAYAAHAIILSDAELDSFCVGGFDFNLNAAYAFRSAVISQNNIAAVASVNSTSNISVSGTNQATVINQGNSAVANQLNLNTVIAQSGDLVNALIDNINIAQVSNLFTGAGDSSETGVAVNGLSFDASTDTLDTLIDTFSNENSATPATDTVAPTISGTVNSVQASASAVAAQTNIAAILAPNGSIINGEINNTNIASVENQGNAGLAAQTNIAIVISQNDINNAVVNNLNVANVDNVNTTDSGGAQVHSASLAGVTMNYSVNDVRANNGARASQANITFVKSLRGRIRRRMVRELNFSRIFNRR